VADGTSESIEERGVHNPKVIDLISRDAETGDVVLAMIERRPWGAAPDQIRQIEDKFNAYLQYTLGGNLEHDYPQYAGAPIRIQLECEQVPGDTEAAFIDSIVKFAAQENIEFVVLVRERS
jgi:hypothetical protein